MKCLFVAMAAVLTLAPNVLPAGESYDNRMPECGERQGFGRTSQGRLFGCLPLCCVDDADHICDCDTPCCEYCGRKRPTPKKKKSLLSCLGCEEVPRGVVGMSIAARMNQLGVDDRNSESAADEESATEEEGAAEDETRSRMDKLESDLTRLTLVVEELARSQQRQQQDLTRATLMLEQLVPAVPRP